MKPLRRVFVSDIHMGTAAAVADNIPDKKPYCWLSAEENSTLAEFLKSDTVQTADQLFIVGDLVDLWVYPVDVRPPSPDEIINAQHNRAIVSALRTFAAQPHKQLIYIGGNHDMQVDALVAHQLAPNTVFGPVYEEFPLRVTHGHDLCLFNSRDPGGRKYPLGYFITRCCATAARDGAAHDMGWNFWSLFNGADEIVRWIKDGKPLSQCVLDFVKDSTGVSDTAPIVMPDGSTTTLAEVKQQYAHLVDDWNAHKSNHAATAVLCEWDPWSDMPIGTQRVNIMGHSHRRVFANNDNYGIYVNLGTWCEGIPNFAMVEVAEADPDDMLVQLCRWQNGDVTIDRRDHFQLQG